MNADQELVLKRVMLRINEQGCGIALGLVFGLGLFVATIMLVARGGENVGPHLSLLGVYFPGYRVTLFGSLLGFVYAFVLGYGIGRTVGGVYNHFAHRAK